jgi:hypothetical protein
MAVPNRAAIVKKFHRVLKKNYTPVLPPADRTVMEHLIYACCLENSSYDKADRAFAVLKNEFFDWNEIRVTTIGELVESLAGLADPPATAGALKQILQSLFEVQYSFDLELCKKQNIGKTVKFLEERRGSTPFMIGYATQHALGGHAIPVCRVSLHLLHVVGVIDTEEFEKGMVPGLDRAIPKAKGIEFASLLHQMACELAASPGSRKLLAALQEVAPDARQRLPGGTEVPALEEEQTPSAPADPASKRASRKKAAAPEPSPMEKDTPEETLPRPKKDSPADCGKETDAAAADASTSKQLSKRKPR